MMVHCTVHYTALHCALQCALHWTLNCSLYHALHYVLRCALYCTAQVRQPGRSACSTTQVPMASRCSVRQCCAVLCSAQCCTVFSGVHSVQCCKSVQCCAVQCSALQGLFSGMRVLLALSSMLYILRLVGFGYLTRALQVRPLSQLGRCSAASSAV
jgi:hypothetical protein